MQGNEDVSLRELAALKEVGLTGRLGDSALVRQLLRNDMVADVHSGQLRLTAKGRSTLVRGSPSLWDIAS